MINDRYELAKRLTAVKRITFDKTKLKKINYLMRLVLFSPNVLLFEEQLNKFIDTN
jgi:hypothetical protein